MNFNKKITVLAAVMGALTVIIGAFGAHGLKEIVSEKTITSFETGVRYQMFHVILFSLLDFQPLLTKKLKNGYLVFLFLESYYFQDLFIL